MTVVRRLWEHFLPPPIESAHALGRFLSAEASRLAQSATYEYTRNTLAYSGRAAFADDEFNRAFRLCRWEAYAAVLADFVVASEGRLRGAAEEPTALRGPLVTLFGALLEEYPRPDHRPAGWGDAAGVLGQRLAEAAERDPAPVSRIAKTAARRIYEVVPVHSEIKAEDRKVIEGAIVFGTIAVFDRLDGRLRAAPVARDLLAGAGPP